jgi:hypothetical protein
MIYVAGFLSLIILVRSIATPYLYSRLTLLYLVIDILPREM